MTSQTQRLLKAQAKGMAVESRALRTEERKALSSARWCKTNNQPSVEDYAAHVGLYTERMRLRNDSRSLHLARAFLKGTPYNVVENTRKGEDAFLESLLVQSAFTIAGFDAPDIIGDLITWAGLDQ